MKKQGKITYQSNNEHLLNVVIQLTRIANALEENNKIAKLKINLSKSEVNSIDKSISYGGTNGNNN